MMQRRLSTAVDGPCGSGGTHALVTDSRHVPHCATHLWREDLVTLQGLQETDNLACDKHHCSVDQWLVTLEGKLEDMITKEATPLVDMPS